MVGINIDNNIKVTDDYEPGDTLMQVTNNQLISDAVYFVVCNASGESKHYSLVPIMTHYQDSIEASFNSMSNLISYYRRQKVYFTKCDVSISVRLEK